MCDAAASILNSVRTLESIERQYDSTRYELRGAGRYREMTRFPSNQVAGADGEQPCV